MHNDVENQEGREVLAMDVINIEEIRKSNQLKQEKCSEAKEAMKGMLSEDQREKFDGVFDSVAREVFKGVIMKEKGRD